MKLKSFKLFAALILAATALSSCASSEEDDPISEPKRYGRLPVDPVGQRVFYEGWRHPSRSM